jgi:hypothetical protein
MAGLDDSLLSLVRKREEVALEPVVMPAAEEPPPPPDSPPPPVQLDILQVEEPPPAVPPTRSRRSEGFGSGSGGGGHGKPCPQCGSERHKKKPITCPFKLWTDDFPIVPRYEKESMRDAHRRHWEIVRHIFVENGQYIKRNGWNFAGPPNNGIAAAAMSAERASSNAAAAAASSSSASITTTAGYSFSPLNDKHLPSGSLLDLGDVNGDSDDDLAEESGPCPECGVVRHKKKPITCAFKLWTEDFPVVPKFEGESTRDAQQRIWGSVRMHFLENGHYVHREGYSFQGPPGVELPNLGSFDHAAMKTPRMFPLKPIAATPLMLGADASSDNEDNKLL